MISRRVLIVGSSGMLGHVVTQYLREENKHTVLDIGPRRKIFKNSVVCDLEDKEEIASVIEGLAPDLVINCVGVLVRMSEERKREAIWLNSYLPHLMSDICSHIGARFIHISTDCVFSGALGPYTESSIKDGTDFYGRTKSLGEPCGADDLTIRTSIIGPELRNNGTGLFDWFFRQRGEVQGYTKALWSGVTTLELARCISHFIDELADLKGLVHYSVSNGISKYQLLCALRSIFKKDIMIQAVDEPVLDKRLINTRKDFKHSPPNYDVQLMELHRWMEKHAAFYSSMKVQR